MIFMYAKRALNNDSKSKSIADSSIEEIRLTVKI